MAKAKRGGKALTGILCFIFGIVFAIIVEVAAIAAGIYFLVNSDIDDLLSTVGVDNTDEDGNKIYINTDLEELTTVYDLVTTFSTLASGYSEGSLTVGELAGYFPVIGTIVDAVFDSLGDTLSDYIGEDSFEEVFNKEEFLETPISELTTYLFNCVTGINLFDLIDDVYTDDAILAYMKYGVSGIGYDEESESWTATYHCLDEDCESGTHKATVEVDCENYETDEETGKKTAYLITGVYYVADDGEEVEASTETSQIVDRISGILTDLTIEDIIGGISEDNTVLYALRNSTISSIADNIQTLTIQEIFTEAIYGVTEGEGNEATTTVTLYKVVESGADTDNDEIDFNKAYLYYYYNDGELTLLGHLDEYTGGYGTLYTYGETQGAWKLLLYSEGVEVAYTINDVSNLQSNLIANIGNATINDLCDMGILNVGEEYLTMTIHYNDDDCVLGELTLSDYFSYTLTLIPSNTQSP